MNVPLRLETPPAGQPYPDEVDDIVRAIRSWRCVTPEQRTALRTAVAMLPVTDWADREQPAPDKPLRVAEVAAILAVSKQHVRDLIRSGRLRAIRLSDNPRSEFRVPESAVRDYLDDATYRAPA